MTTVEHVAGQAPAATGHASRHAGTAVTFRDAEGDLLSRTRRAHEPGAPLLTAVRCVSADGARRLGGDAYSIASRDGQMLLLVADARGKGDGAAVLARASLEVFRTVAANMSRWNPSRILRVLDETVRCAGHDEDFMTAVLVHAQRDGRLQVLSCGHPPPLIVGRECIRAVDLEPCRPLGLGSAPVVVRERLAPGDRLLLFTDGVSEAVDHAGNFFDVEEHAAVLRCSDVEVAVDALLGRLVRHIGGGSQDDLTLLVAARRSEADGFPLDRATDALASAAPAASR